MRRASRTLAATLVVFLLAVGFVACGGEDGSNDSTDATSESGAGLNEGSASAPAGEGGGALSSDEAADAEEAQARRGEASKLTPKKHSDSGGGSAQFKVKGGDNSVQEFGEEAGSEEFDAAAVALHNFLDARAEANWAAACQYMSSTLIESFEKLAAQARQAEGSSCGAIVEKLTNPAAAQAMKEEAAKANVGSLRIEGKQAFVIYTGIDGAVMAMPMANEGDEWKVAALAGTPLS